MSRPTTTIMNDYKKHEGETCDKLYNLPNFGKFAKRHELPNRICKELECFCLVFRLREDQEMSSLINKLALCFQTGDVMSE